MVVDCTYDLGWNANTTIEFDYRGTDAASSHDKINICSA